MGDYKAKVDEALRLYTDDRGQEAISMLSGVYDQIPTSDSATLGLAGSLFRSYGDTTKAIDCFQRLLEADPLSPRASLGLFHSFWNDGQYLVALDELSRFFLASRESDRLSAVNEDGEHNRLLSEMSDAYFEPNEERPEDPLVLIESLRNRSRAFDLHKS